MILVYMSCRRKESLRLLSHLLMILLFINYDYKTYSVSYQGRASTGSLALAIG